MIVDCSFCGTPFHPKNQDRRCSTECRLWSRVDKNGPILRPELGECWVWTGRTRTGYGAFRIGRRTVSAHCISFEIANGVTLPRRTNGPDDVFVLHRCDNRRCVRPSHLFAGSHQANMDDMAAKGRKVVARGDRHGTRLHPESRPRGERHWSARMPERLPRGDDHWSRRDPSRAARGDRSGSRLHPESRPRGENNGNSKLTNEAVQAIRRRRSAGESLRSIAAAYAVTRPLIGMICSRKIWAHVPDANGGESQ